MKRMAWVLAVMLCSAALLNAGDANQGKEMSGWLCNSKCVTQADNKASCDKNCTETGGDVVFIDSKGAVSKIENQDKVASMAGKQVKMKVSMNKEKGMYVYEIAPATY
jgi:hypothetical protein